MGEFVMRRVRSWNRFAFQHSAWCPAIGVMPLHGHAWLVARWLPWSKWRRLIVPLAPAGWYKERHSHSPPSKRA